MKSLAKAMSLVVLVVACLVPPAPFGFVDGTTEARTKRYKKYTHVRKAHIRRYHGRKVKVATQEPAGGLVSNAASASASVKPFRLLSRQEILAADPALLERIGRHVMVGYHGFNDVKALVEKRAIAGVFITDHNARGRKAEAIKANIDSLQAIRAQQGMPPLIIAADQEGGTVSRLSPPLKRQKSLSAILRGLPDDAARRAAVEDFADMQAAELKRISVTLNFAPVVDLNLNPQNNRDGETRLRMRAISADPAIVAKVAGWYCDTIAQAGIMCTLKHFPGLGRVTRDTHVATGEISASADTLENNDWIPFRQVMKKSNAVIMIGHVRIGAIDKDTPASFSKAVIGNLIRKTWGYDGLVITDDFSMGAITRSQGGIGNAAVKTLNAGSDIVLVSYMEKHFDTVMSALLAADQAGDIDTSARESSVARIGRVFKFAAKSGAAAR